MIFIIEKSEIELESSLHTMMLLLPDSFFHKQVEETIFIPAEKISREQNLDLDLVLTRIELYRAVYGFSRSRELLKNNSIDAVHLGKNKNREFGDSCLYKFSSFFPIDREFEDKIN